MQKRDKHPDPSWNIGGAAGCGVYMVFTDEDGGTLIFESKSEQEKRSLGILDGMKFSYYIVAHGWTEAMTKLHKKQGLEPYKPLEFN